MHLALNAANMDKGGISCAATAWTQYLIKKPHAKVREENTQGVEFLVHKMVKVVIERHLAMLRQNHMPRCLPGPNGTVKSLQTRWRCKGTGAPWPNWRRQQTPEPMPSLSRKPAASTSNTSGAPSLEIVYVPAGYAYSDTSLPCAELFTLVTYAQDSEHNTEFDPDMLPDEGTSTN
jgi:hypothetical protein